jgi:hypothetical protein
VIRGAMSSLAVIVAIGGCDRTASLREAAASTRPAGSEANLCVTEGGPIRPDDAGVFPIDVPKFRAVSALPTDATAELRFTYLGPTDVTAPLGSGRERRQIGLKLRAQNGCNLVYAMWRLEPAAQISVQVKSNPGETTFAQCKNGGYRTVHALRETAPPDVLPGSAHTLRASMQGGTLSVWADGVLAWEGPVGDDALAFDGPVGLRTDNGRFSVSFVAGTEGARGAPRPCREAEGE